MFSFNRTRTGEQSNGTTDGRRETTPESSFDAPTTGLVHTEDVVANLRALGLPANATWEDAVAAHSRLVSDLTPGPEASHRNVALAERYLREVNHAFASLRVLAVA